MEYQYTGRNWAEDFKYENGNYENECMFCRQLFVGHKRRVVCKVCSDAKGLTPVQETKRQETGSC